MYILASGGGDILFQFGGRYYNEFNGGRWLDESNLLVVENFPGLDEK